MNFNKLSLLAQIGFATLAGDGLSLKKLKICFWRSILSKRAFMDTKSRANFAVKLATCNRIVQGAVHTFQQCTILINKLAVVVVVVTSSLL